MIAHLMEQITREIKPIVQINYDIADNYKNMGFEYKDIAYNMGFKFINGSITKRNIRFYKLNKHYNGFCLFEARKFSSINCTIQFKGVKL